MSLPGLRITEPVFYFKLQNKIGSRMSNSFSVDHTALDHIQTGITTCNIDESHQEYRLETVSNRLLGALTSFTGPVSSPTACAVVQNIWSHKGFLTHQ